MFLPAQRSELRTANCELPNVNDGPFKRRGAPEQARRPGPAQRCKAATNCAQKNSASAFLVGTLQLLPELIPVVLEPLWARASELGLSARPRRRTWRRRLLNGLEETLPNQFLAEGHRLLERVRL